MTARIWHHRLNPTAALAAVIAAFVVWSVIAAPNSSARPVDEPESLALAAEEADGEPVGAEVVIGVEEDRLVVPLADVGAVGLRERSGLEPATPGESRWDLPGGSDASPWAAVLGPEGLLYVTDGGTGTVERFDPVTGAYRDLVVDAEATGAAAAAAIAADPSLGDGSDVRFVPRGLAFGPEGELVVVDAGLGALWTIQPPDVVAEDDEAEGVEAQAPALVGAPIGLGVLVDPVAVAVDDDGTVLVTDRGDDDIERFDLATGEHLGTVAVLDPGARPSGLTWAVGGGLLVAATGTGAIVPVDPATGDTGDALIDGLVDPVGVMMETDGTVWISERFADTTRAGA
ncbi:MAG: hypothetical protein AAFO29_09555 [Actinomycetota bacterium]